MTDAREFDLNVQRVLESWTIAHAIRELIANALDEAVLSGSQEPAIVKGPDGRWHITDFGRALTGELGDIAMSSLTDRSSRKAPSST